MIGSDGSSLSTEGPLSGGNPHPRNFGAFPRVLSEYVKRRGVLTLEDAVRKMTSLPAQRFSLNDRGTLDEGKWADIVVFDLDAVRDATFENPKQYPSGIPFVMVNGVWVIKDSQFTGKLPGRLAGRN
jgi:N-acyl-D-aspartate/D-glutamate deacylase